MSSCATNKNPPCVACGENVMIPSCSSGNVIHQNNNMCQTCLQALVSIAEEDFENNEIYAAEDNNLNAKMVTATVWNGQNDARTCAVCGNRIEDATTSSQLCRSCEMDVAGSEEDDLYLEPSQAFPIDNNNKHKNTIDVSSPPAHDVFCTPPEASSRLMVKLLIPQKAVGIKRHLEEALEQGDLIQLKLGERHHHQDETDMTLMSGRLTAVITKSDDPSEKIQNSLPSIVSPPSSQQDTGKEEQGFASAACAPSMPTFPGQNTATLPRGGECRVCGMKLNTAWKVLCDACEYLHSKDKKQEDLPEQQQFDPQKQPPYAYQHPCTSLDPRMMTNTRVAAGLVSPPSARKPRRMTEQQQQQSQPHPCMDCGVKVTEVWKPRCGSCYSKFKLHEPAVKGKVR